MIGYSDSTFGADSFAFISRDKRGVASNVATMQVNIMRTYDLEVLQTADLDPVDHASWLTDGAYYRFPYSATDYSVALMFFVSKSNGRHAGAFRHEPGSLVRTVMTSPKLDSTTFKLEEGEEHPTSIVVDSARRLLFIGCDSRPGRIIVYGFDKTTVTRKTSLELSSTTHTVGAPFNGLNCLVWHPTLNTLFAGLNKSPGIVVAISVAVTGTGVDAEVKLGFESSMQTGVNVISSGVVGSSNRVYFTGLFHSRGVVQVYDPAASNPLATTIEFDDTNAAGALSSAYDPLNDAVYFATNNHPAKIVKLSLADNVQTTTTLDQATGESFPFSISVDPEASCDSSVADRESSTKFGPDEVPGDNDNTAKPAPCGIVFVTTLGQNRRDLGWATNPSIVKLNARTMTILDRVQVKVDQSEGVGPIRTCAVDTEGGQMYCGTDFYPASVIKVDI